MHYGITQIWDAGRCIKTLSDHTGSVRELQFDSQKLVSYVYFYVVVKKSFLVLLFSDNILRGSRDCTLRVYSLPDITTKPSGKDHYVLAAIKGGSGHLSRIRSIHCSSGRIVSGNFLPRAPSQDDGSLAHFCSPHLPPPQKRLVGQDRKDLVLC